MNAIATDLRELDGIPLLIAFQSGRRNYHAWCDFCRRWHCHGDLNQPVEHRLAHCHAPASPYRDRGYLLKAREPTPAIRLAILRGKAPPRGEGRS